ncbi:MAG TPA: galactose oxidase, partial [Candidatus Limnocylindria bacterium]|nr:galactose oxidase [Candidatus Limnocylindria bacterium]
TPRDHLAVVTFGGRVCAVGGRRLSLAQNLGAFDCYDPGTDRWEAHPDLPTPRGGLGAAVLDGALYVAGGEQPFGTFREVEAFDGARWSRAPDLRTPRHGLSVASARGVLFVIAGGPTPGGSQTSVNEGLVVRT